MLIGRRDSSLVVDTLRDLSREQNTTVGYFYFDFTARKELPTVDILGSLLKQMMSETEFAPGEISKAMREQIKSIDGHESWLVNIVQMLRLITSSRPTFLCIDGLDECGGVQRARVLESLKQILEKSPGARVFVTGGSPVGAGMEEHLPGRVASVSANLRKDDIATYIRSRLAKDRSQNAMDECLEAEILENILGNISGM